MVQFWTDAAPNTIENFKKLARSGFYNGTIFHRIVKGFMVQGGDPNSKDPAKENRYGEGGPGYKIKAEFNDHPHERGVISMARQADPNSASCQFFLCHQTVPFLDNNYAAFGRVVRGLETIDAIAAVPCVFAPGGVDKEPSKPKEKVTIRKIRLVPPAGAQGSR